MDKIRWTEKEVIKATGAELLKKGACDNFKSIMTDSRQIAEKDLFLALKGERHDAHDFINQAMKAGCSALIIDKKKWPELKGTLLNRGITVFGADNTLKALANLASYHLKKNKVKVIAITGSNGKTSTKEMLGLIFKKYSSCLVSKANFNNEIGLPLSLLELKNKDKWAVLELGMNHPGEIDRLAAICKPDMALITNIAKAHLKGLGSIKEVAKAKAEIFTHVKNRGPVLINASDPYSKLIPLPLSLDIFYWGDDENSDFYMRNLDLKLDSLSFDILSKNYKSFRIDLPLTGLMMAKNALAAASMALLAGLPPSLIQEALREFKGVPGRFQILKSPKNFFLIDDTYNANPASMHMALNQLKTLNKTGASFAALGSMGELGDKAALFHEETGEVAAKAGLKALYCCGPFKDELVRGARKAGLKEAFAMEKEGLAGELVKRLAEGDWLLVKGSRLMGMESLVKELMKKSPDI